MAIISACAVGSRSARVGLRGGAITSPPRTRTQPTGTSPRSPAARAACSDISMKEVIASLCQVVSAFNAFGYYRCINRRISAQAFREFSGEAVSIDTMANVEGEMNEQGKTGERIAEVIARAGLASRREAEAWIAAGRVAVNGAVIASPALDVTASDRIAIDGEPLPGRERTRLFLYHKPRGLLPTPADPAGRPTIFSVLPKSLPRLVSVGRLDINTEGLLLLTNDGGLARALELPATGWLRRYRVRAHGEVQQDQLEALRGGITIDGIRYGEIEAKLDRAQGSSKGSSKVSNVWLTFAIRE